MIVNPNDDNHRRFVSTANPFLLLGVTPAATRADIELAYLHCLQQQIASEDALKAAVDIVTDPTKRLPHELAYPLDGTSAQVQMFCTAQQASDSELLQLANDGGPLSRLYLVAQLATHQPANGELLFAVLAAQATVGAPELYAVLKAMRSQAGLPAASLLSVAEGLQDLKTAHYERIIAAYADPQDAAQPLLGCSHRVATAHDEHLFEALSHVIRAYERATAELRADLMMKAQDAFESFCQCTNDPQLADQLAQQLQSFVSVTAPTIFLSALNGRMDDDFDALIGNMRQLLADLGESGLYATGLRLAHCCRDMFAFVPTVAHRFTGPSDLLESLAIAAALKPLNDVVEHLETDAPLSVGRLPKSTIAGQMLPGSNLWLTFDRACEATASLHQGERCWLLMRDFAARLAKQPRSADVASVLIATLSQKAQSQMISGHLLKVLDQTKRDIEGAIAAEWRRARRRKVRSVFAAAICVSALLACFVLFDSRPHLATAPVKSAQATPAEVSLANADSSEIGEPEVKPPVGTRQHFSRESVRYCEFQKERLRIIKQHVQWREDAAAYNTLANDYNSRCANYFYRDEDLKLVEEELATDRAKLEAETERVLANWPWRAAGAAPSSRAPIK